MRRAVLVNATRFLLVAGVAVQAWIALSFLIGPYGLGVDIPRLGGWVPEGVFLANADGVLAEIPEVGIDLSTELTESGAVDASTGMPAVELSGPYTAVVNLLNPTRAEQVAYVAVRALVPVLAAVVLWILLRIVSSVGRGSPFTETNAQRIWLLAALIGVGGTAASLASAWLNNYLISRSAAAPAFRTSQVSFEVWPLLVGLLIAVVALTWDRGVFLEEDTEGLI
jgi:hypothetical protein